MAGLLQLPNEITAKIFLELPMEDSLFIRAVCRELRARVDALFAQYYFETRYVMFERRSLDTLTSISKHSSFSQSVQTLDICIHHLLALEELEEIEPPYHSDHSDEEMGEQSKLNEIRYVNCLEDQERLLRTGYAIESLLEAMRRFHHCKRIIISGGQDFHGIFPKHPWGLDQLKEDIGVLPQSIVSFHSKNSVEFVRFVIHAVLAALVISQSQIEELEIEIGYEEEANRISPQMLTSPSSVFFARSPVTSLRKLTILLDPDIPEPSYGLPWGFGLCQFIDLFPELLELWIQFQPDDYELGRFSEVSSQLFVPKLESLDISRTDCTSKELEHVLLRHQRTLRRVGFYDVDLTDGNSCWIRLIELMRDSLQIERFNMMGTDNNYNFMNIDANNLTGVIEILSDWE